MIDILDINEDIGSIALFFYTYLEFFESNVEFLYLSDSLRNNQINKIMTEYRADEPPPSINEPNVRDKIRDKI